MTERTSAPTAQPQDWHGIGQYLEQAEVQLLSPERRREFLETWKDISQQEANLDDAILIGLVGGTGVGKSTFINALAGQEVSRSSDRRPTTDRVIVYRHVNTELPADVPSQHFAQPEVLHDNDRIEKVVLFDFPDFDSAEVSHTHIIRQYLSYLDVLFVVVDDVKYADRRLYELLSELDHDARNVFVLLNKVDRLEKRYGDETQNVIDDLLQDLNEKLVENSQLRLEANQKFPIAALSVYDARLRQVDHPAIRGFNQVEGLLEKYQGDKHRRLVKERNINSRKQELATALVESALGKENETVLAEAKALVVGWRAELDKSLSQVPVEVLNESERRGVRGGHLRVAGPRWGLPFSLFFTLMGEVGRRTRAMIEPSELGQRVMTHYRSFFDAIKNVQQRFLSEFAGSKINLDTLTSIEDVDQLRFAPSETVVELRNAIQNRAEPVPLLRRWLAHVPAVGTLVLAFWGQVYDVIDGETGLLRSLFETLSPTFIVTTIGGVVIVYGLTGLVIWIREIQKLDHRITIAEQLTREAIRLQGQDAVNRLDHDVASLYEEFEMLNTLVLR